MSLAVRVRRLRAAGALSRRHRHLDGHAALSDHAAAARRAGRDAMRGAFAADAAVASFRFIALLPTILSEIRTNQSDRHARRAPCRASRLYLVEVPNSVSVGLATNPPS